jgi:endonuclease YncB( thermonuclease family)
VRLKEIMDVTIKIFPNLTIALVFSMLILVSACGSEVESERQAVEDAVSADHTSSNSDAKSKLSSEHTLVCTDCQLVDVTKVIDGDTLDTSVGRVRLFGIDTPERGDHCFQEATNFTRIAAGTKVRLETGPRRTDSYGRRLAYVYDSSGDSIDAQLISGGFAVAWTRDGQHRDYLTSLEENARRTRTGCLWE